VLWALWHFGVFAKIASIFHRSPAICSTCQHPVVAPVAPVALEPKAVEAVVSSPQADKASMYKLLQAVDMGQI